MTAHIDLDPQVVNQLIALAEARGVSVEELIRDFLDQIHAPAPEGSSGTTNEFEADMLTFAEGTENLNSSYSGNYSREDIYFNHD
jgi:hypothetical protein